MMIQNRRLAMISKKTMLSLVQELRWRDVQWALVENPGLIGFRDRKGRNWLHLCCQVNIKNKRLKAADSNQFRPFLSRNPISPGFSTRAHWTSLHLSSCT